MKNSDLVSLSPHYRIFAHLLNGHSTHSLTQTTGLEYYLLPPTSYLSLERESLDLRPPQKKEKEKKENQNRILLFVSKENASSHTLSTNRGLPSCYILLRCKRISAGTATCIGTRGQEKKRQKGRAGH